MTLLLLGSYILMLMGALYYFTSLGMSIEEKFISMPAHFLSSDLYTICARIWLNTSLYSSQ